MASGITALEVLSLHYWPGREVPETGSLEWHRRWAEIEYIEERILHLQAAAIAKAFGSE